MPVTRFRPPTFVLLLAGGLVALSATGALAGGARIERPVTDQPAAAAAPPAAATAPRSARAIAITPVLNPMRETAPGVYEGIVPVQLPDGSWQVLLDERFHQFTVARRAEGGALRRGCVHGASGLAGWLAGPRVVSPTGTTAATWEVQ